MNRTTMFTKGMHFSELKKWMNRTIAMILVMTMVATTPTMSANAGFLSGLVSSVTRTVSKAVDAIKQTVDTSSSKTVYNFADLDKYVRSNIFAPTDIKVTLGSDITVPSNQCITTAIHNVKMNLNGHTIYSNNRSNAVSVLGKKITISNGRIYQYTQTSGGIISMHSGDIELNNVTLEGASYASGITGIDIGASYASPKIIVKNSTIKNVTTGIRLKDGGRVEADKVTITGCKGDGIYFGYNYSGKTTQLDLSNSKIRYSKGNGVNAEMLQYLGSAVCNLTNVEISGGTTKNRYGIKGGNATVGYNVVKVNLNGTSVVTGNVGGNIGVYSSNPINMDGLDRHDQVSFTCLDLNGGHIGKTVAKVTGNIGDVRSYSVKSDITKYMIYNEMEGGNSSIKIQNPPAQVNVNMETSLISSIHQGTGLEESDANYATISLNGSDDVSKTYAFKYDTRITLATVNKNPDRFVFKGWEKYTKETSNSAWTLMDSSVSTNPIIKVDVINEYVKYVAKYDYKKYRITVSASGKDAQVQVNGGSYSSKVDTYYYVDEKLTLKARDDYQSGSSNYKFRIWNTGATTRSIQVKVTKDEVYIAQFIKEAGSTGTMYLGLKEVKTYNELKNLSDGTNLILLYVGASSGNKKLEISSNGNLAMVGVPEGSAIMRKGDFINSTKKVIYSDTGMSGTQRHGDSCSYCCNDKTTDGSDALCVTWTQKAAQFDGCNPGFIKPSNELKDSNGQSYWVYWCCAGGRRAAGPFVLYKYDTAVTFNTDTIRVSMNPDFVPGKSQYDDKNINSNQLIVTARGADGRTYTLGGMKFDELGYDHEIDYVQGDKTVTFEVDGVTMVFDFPEAILGNRNSGTQYTSLKDALLAAHDDNVIIVGPGVNKIDTAIDVEENVKIVGYEGENVTTKEISQVRVDDDGTVHLDGGTLEAMPKDGNNVDVGLMNGIVSANDTVILTTHTGEGEDQVQAPAVIAVNDNVKISISPDGNREHKVTIENTAQGNSYGLNKSSYNGEKITVSENTGYKLVISEATEEEEEKVIEIGQFNSGSTTITSENGDGLKVSMTGEGDQIKIGDKTFSTASNNQTSFVVNANPTEDGADIILTEGLVNVPNGASVQVNNTVLKNTGDQGGAITVQEDGSVVIPDGGGLVINGVEIKVPHTEPLNSNTTVKLDSNGNPQIVTTGDSTVEVIINGQSTVFKTGDYDCSFHLDADGTPVLDNGDLVLQPGQIVRDRLGNEYKCPEDGSEITIMTTPFVKDEDGNIVGGGAISMDIPAGEAVECKAQGQNSYVKFENPGNDIGFFNLDPENAEEGIQSDSVLTISSGKIVNLSAGGNSVSVEVTGNSISIDGSTSAITIGSAGDKVIIEGKEYVALSDNTVLTVIEEGVVIQEGSTSVPANGKVLVDGTSIFATSADAVTVDVAASTDGKSIQLNTKANKSFSIAPQGKDGDKVTFASGEDKTYQINESGNLVLGNGEQINMIAKGGKSISIKVPETSANGVELDVIAKPLSSELMDEENAVTPISGLKISLTNNESVEINGHSYKQAQLEVGENDGELGVAASLDIVVENDGSVLLQGGAVELSNNAEIAFYDVENAKTYAKNKSEGKEIQVMAPGVVIAPTAGTTVELGNKKDKTSVSFTTTEANTELAYTKDICLLKKGGVELDSEQKVLIGDFVVKNTAKTADKKVITKLVETENTDSETKDICPIITTGEIVVPAEGSFTVAGMGSDKELTYKSNQVGGEGNTVFTINKYGNIELGNGGIVEFTDNSKQKIEIQANSDGISTLPTEEGLYLEIPANGSITIGDKQYDNLSASETMLLMVDYDGRVVLVKGDVQLAEGAIVYVQNEKNELTPIQCLADEDSESNKTMEVKFGGKNITYDEDGKVESIQVDEVSIIVPEETEIAVGGNKYQNVNDTNATLTVDIASDSIGEIGSKVDASRVVLTDGTLEVKAGSGISIEQEKDGQKEKKVVQNTGSKKSDGTVVIEIHEESERPDKGASVTMDEGTKVKVQTVSNGEVVGNNTIEVPKTEEVEGEVGTEYQVTIGLEVSDQDMKVIVSTTEGQPIKDASVIINNATYTSEEENQELVLHLDSESKNVELSESNKSVGIENGSVQIGDKTVSASDKATIVVEKGNDDQTSLSLFIPAGGEASIVDGSNSENDVIIKVPENNGNGEESEEKTIIIGEDGKIKTELKKDEKIVIGGVEYTGNEDDEEKDTITFDPKNGQLEENEEGGVKPSESIDAETFNREDYSRTIINGESISVSGVEYKADENSTVIISGNPEGYPIVTLQNQDDVVSIGDIEYKAVSDNSALVVDANGAVTLQDNGSPSAENNTKVEFLGSGIREVDGVTYTLDATVNGGIVVACGGASEPDQITVKEGAIIAVSQPAGMEVLSNEVGMDVDEPTNQNRTVGVGSLASRMKKASAKKLASGTDVKIIARNDSHYTLDSRTTTLTMLSPMKKTIATPEIGEAKPDGTYKLISVMLTEESSGGGSSGGGGGGFAGTYVSGVKIRAEKTTLTKAGETTKLQADIVPENATDKAVVWISLDENIVTVDQTGLVTAVANGVTKVTVKTHDGGYTDSIEITVEIDDDEEPGDDQPGDEQPGDEQPGDDQPGDEQPGNEVVDERNLTGNDLYHRNDLPKMYAYAKGNKTSVSMSWTKRTGTYRYEVYWSCTSGKTIYKKLITTSKTTASHKKLSAEKKYKYFVVAYKYVNGKKVYTYKSPTMYVALKDGKYTNVKSIKVAKSSISIKVAKTYTLKPTVTLENTKKKAVSNVSHLRYYSSNKSIATVNFKTGKITAKKKGTCYIYIVANNGFYKKVKVTIK